MESVGKKTRLQICYLLPLLFGFVASHKMCANSTNAKYIAKNSLEKIDILSCAVGEYFLIPVNNWWECFYVLGGFSD